MPAPTTNAEFLELIQKSGVVEDNRVSTYVEQLQAGPGVPAEPSKLAGLFVRDGLLTYFQAEQFLLGKWKRFTIGRYKVLERLGSGGMGQVFLCEHKMMRRRVAVKVLPTAKAEDRSSLDRFYREARAVAALDHPNIVRAYDIDQDDNLHFLVMEYVDGVSLQDLIKRAGPLDAVRAAHYIAQSSIGLQNAHECGLIHRDIKPGNLLVDRQGMVKILDMGLARFFHDEEDNITRNNDESVLGTADYLAPEQALDSHTVDIRADIYSLGATFYFLLTGSPPFAEGTVAQKLIWHQTRQPRPIKALRPEVPDALIAVLNTMMAKDREHRYQHPVEVAHALAPWTQMQIPPPTEAEIPPLCPAAQGTATSQPPPPTRPAPLPVPPPPRAPATMRATAPAPPVPVPTLAATGAAPALRPGAIGHSGMAPALAPQTPQPMPTNGKPADTPPVNTTRPPAGDNSALWETLATEGATRPSGSNPSVSRTPRPGPRSDRRKAAAKGIPPLVLWGGLAGVVLFLAVFGFLVLWFFFPGTGKSGLTGPAPLLVGPGGQYKKVSEALLKAKPGDRIEIRDNLDESIVLKGIEGITLEGSSGTKFTLKPGVGGQNALRIEDAKDVTVRNLNISGGSQGAIKVSGSCSGLVLDDLIVSGYNKTGVRFVAATGTEAKPIRMSNCTVRGGGGGPESAIEFSAIGGVMAKQLPTQFLRVEESKLLGPFKDAAIVVAGAVESVEFSQNRVWQTARGVQFRRPLTPTWWDITFRSNTFGNMDGVGIEWAIGDQAAPDGKANKLLLDRNYFFSTKMLVASEGNKPFGTVDFRSNARSPDTAENPDGKLATGAATIDANLSTKSGDDRTFLKTVPDSPLAKAPGGPVGYTGNDK